MRNYRILAGVTGGGSGTAVTSKMECIVIMVNSEKPLTIITKRSILDVAAVLDPPLATTKTCSDCVLYLQMKIMIGWEYQNIADWNKSYCYQLFYKAKDSLPRQKVFYFEKNKQPLYTIFEAKGVDKCWYHIPTLDNFDEWF